MEHTEGKLRLFGSDLIFCTDDGLGIGEVFTGDESTDEITEAKANAARIVKTWNMHYDLVEALKKIREMIVIKNGKATMNTSPEFVAENIDALIEKATSLSPTPNH